jgi:hypothetical protein
MSKFKVKRSKSFRHFGWINDVLILISVSKNLKLPDICLKAYIKTNVKTIKIFNSFHPNLFAYFNLK